MNSSRISILCGLLTFAGIVLALLSATDLCNFGGCTTAHEYRFFGIHLAAVGVTFFGLLAATMLAAPRLPLAGRLISPLLAGGAGAEIMLLHLQKNVIQAWCPLCVGIAIVVLLLCMLQTCRFLLESRRLPTMNRRVFLSKLLIIVVALLSGFFVSLAGIGKPEAAASPLDTGLGKQSKVEVYVFSDWLCPVCVRIEPAIEAALPTLEKKARVYFVDKIIHQEAMNFVPYHLSFQVHEKSKYLQLRKALFALAKRTKNPTPDDVKAAIAPLGVTYKQLSFMDVTQLMARSQALATQFKVNATPVVVVTNSATRKVKTLIGGAEITQDNILKAIRNLE
jgi:protein-disulfide isomerase/uncharacterized membrane protein